MGVIYNGAHAITFTKLRDNTTKNSWRDLSLIPSSKPYIQPPKPQFDYTPLARSKEIIDLSMALRKTFGFESTQGQWEFYIDHEDWKWTNWTQEYWELEYFFDGTMFSVKLDDPGDNNIYTGTISIASYKPGEDFSTITLAYNINWLLDADMMPDWYGSPYPKYIEIIKNPDGEPFDDYAPIDYTGIEVRLLNALKEPFEDSTHPGGIIPLEELTFDKDTAIWMYADTIPINVSWTNTYKEDSVLTASFDLKVNIPTTPTQLEVYKVPDKIKYVDGDIIDYDGMIIKAKLANGTYFVDEQYPDSIVPLSELERLPRDADATNPTINVSWYEPYHGRLCSGSFNIAVCGNWPTKMIIETMPTKTTYTGGDLIDLTGIDVRLYREDDEYFVNSTYQNGKVPISNLKIVTRYATNEALNFDGGTGRNVLYGCYETEKSYNEGYVYGGNSRYDEKYKSSNINKEVRILRCYISGNPTADYLEAEITFDIIGNKYASGGGNFTDLISGKENSGYSSNMQWYLVEHNDAMFAGRKLTTMETEEDDVAWDFIGYFTFGRVTLIGNTIEYNDAYDDKYISGALGRYPVEIQNENAKYDVINESYDPLGTTDYGLPSRLLYPNFQTSEQNKLKLSMTIKNVSSNRQVSAVIKILCVFLKKSGGVISDVVTIANYGEVTYDTTSTFEVPFKNYKTEIPIIVVCTSEEWPSSTVFEDSTTNALRGGYLLIERLP